MSLYNGSTENDVLNEPDWAKSHRHRIGVRNREDRFPGLTDDDEDWRHEIEEEATERMDELKEMVSKGNLLSVRDFLNKQEWRYVLHTTEKFIKESQPWFINQKKKEKQQQVQQQNEQQQGSQSQQQRQQQGGESDGDKMQVDDDQQGHSDQEQDPMDKYSVQRRMLYQNMKEESEYIKNLKQHDGQGTSPAKSASAFSEIDEADQFTPDNWVARTDHLLRLTSKHPMNGEPDLVALYNAGFITPNHLHFIRNHGAVPHILWETHKLNVSAGKTINLSMDDLAEGFPSINIPVFLACDGNRRKELNMIRRSKGFNWGPCAMGCAYWRGALLRDVLVAAEVSKVVERDPLKRFWVNFEGADELSAGKYATCVPLEYVMDSNHDVMIAYEMNDSPIPPDHGYPARLLLPGFVGGRCVKWLAKIWITDHENDSYYHIYDNRVLPDFVTGSEPEFMELMYRHPSTLIYDQALNSLIVKPSQGEKIALDDVKQARTYRVEGLAYSGSGEEVQRVEISLDGGQTWLYCVRRYPDAPLRHNRKFWTWLHWHIDVDITMLLRADSIAVRCFDIKKNSQPRVPAWNLEGMMNNSWYIVRPEITEDAKNNQSFLLFRHPVEPGTGQNGWVKPSVEDQFEDNMRQSSAPTKQFTREEIEKHSTEQSCWIVINNRVYDATSVLSWHPGGKQAILPHAGRTHMDTTEEYESIHDAFARDKLEECIIGVVTQKCADYMKKDAEENAKQKAEAARGPEVALKSHKWTRIRLSKKSTVSEDTHRYEFSLPPPSKKLGLEIGQHLYLGFHLEDQLVVRPYTPVWPLFENEANGTFNLVVKTYYPDPSQPGGTMSNILDCLSIGEEVEVKGPSGLIRYRGNGNFIMEDKEYNFDRITLVLGGSGITPGYQLIAHILQSPNDKTKIKVIDANKSKGDILLRGELYELSQKHSDQFEICHVLSHPGRDRQGEKGHVDKRILHEYSFPPEDGNVALLCGPPTLIKKAVLPGLTDWGYHEDRNLFGF